MNLSLSDVLLIVSVILPVLVPLGATLFKHLVDASPRISVKRWWTPYG